MLAVPRKLRIRVMQSTSFNAKPGQYWVLCSLLLLVYLMPSLFHLEDYAWNYDEGPQLQAAALTYADYLDFVEGDFNIFVHLTGSSGELVSQFEGPPLWGWYPTSWCFPGVIIPDPHPLDLPRDLPPGTYRIWVGMYQWPSLERLPAFLSDGARWPDDRILLIEVAPAVPDLLGMTKP